MQVFLIDNYNTNVLNVFHPLGARLRLNYHLQYLHCCFLSVSEICTQSIKIGCSTLIEMTNAEIQGKRENGFWERKKNCQSNRTQCHIKHLKPAPSSLPALAQVCTCTWLPLWSMSCSIKGNGVGGTCALAVALCCSWKSLAMVVFECRGTLTVFPWLMVKFEIKEGKQHRDVFLLFLY